MADLGSLRVKLVADLRKFVAGMKQGIASVKTFSAGVVSGMRRAARAIADFAIRAGRSLAAFASRWLKRAAIAVVAFSAAMVKMAIDVEESENLIRVSFKGMTQSVIDWSEKLQKELGLNANTLRRQAGLLNLLTKSMGLTTEQAFRLSTSITEIAVHVASLRNEGLEVTLEKMRSGLLGMSRPLKDIGINVDENAIGNLLYKEGIDATAGSMTQAQKIMARYILILQAAEEDTGDLARTADDTQNVFRVFMEQVKLLMEQMGGKLLPIINAVAISMRDWLMANREDIVAWFGTMVDNLQGVITFLKVDYRRGFEGTLDVLIALLGAFAQSMVAIWRLTWTKMGEDVLPLLVAGISAGVAKVKGILAAAGRNIAELIMAPITGDPIFTTFTEAIAGKTINLSLELKQVYTELHTRLKQITAETLAWGAAHGKTGEEIKAEQEARLARDKELARINEEIRAKRLVDLQNMLADLKTSLAETKQIQDATTEVVEQTLTKWQSMWEDAAGSIVGSMRTAWADMILQAKSGTEIIAALVQRMARSIIEASFTAFVQPGIMKIFGAIAGRGIGVQRSPATRTAEFFSGGGVVKPVYAATGFVAKGTDTVPAMLTPGEMVLPKELVELLGNSGGSITFNVNAIDAQNTAQWLNNNKRLIAGMIYDTSRGNNPASRRLGN